MASESVRRAAVAGACLVVAVAAWLWLTTRQVATGAGGSAGRAAASPSGAGQVAVPDVRLEALRQKRLPP